MFFRKKICEIYNRKQSFIHKPVIETWKNMYNKRMICKKL